MKRLFFTLAALALALFAMPQHVAAQTIQTPLFYNYPVTVGIGAYNPLVYHRKKDAAGSLAVNYGMLIPMLTESVKGQKSEKDMAITELETRLVEKDRQISAMEMRMAKLEALLTDSRSGEVAPVKAEPSVTLKSRPNPFSEVTTVDFNLPASVKTATLLVTDLQGKVLHQQTLETRGQGNVQVNLSGFASGTYICTMFTDGIPAANTKLSLQAK